MDDKLISPSAFSKCELHVEVDGNELHIPINFGMTDDEVRKLYPYLLSISRLENNPMISYSAIKESGKLEDYPEEVRERYEKWAKRMSRYWYDKPSTTLLDVAIGLAIDMKMNGVMLGDIIDPPETSYEGFMENPMNPDPESITDEEVEAIEQKYGIGPNANAKVTLKGELNAHENVAGNVDVSMYGDNGEDDFISKQLDEMEADVVTKDIFAGIIEDDYNAADKERYEMTYKKGKTFDEGQINKDGILQMYANNDMFSKIEREMLDDEPGDNFDDDDEDDFGEERYADEAGFDDEDDDNIDDDEDPRVRSFADDDDDDEDF